MSETEIHTGKMKLVETSLSVIDFMKEKLKERQIKLEDDADYDDVADKFFEVFYKKYFITKSKNLYEILEDEELEYSFAKFKHNPDGTIDYMVMFYNGGASLTEVLEECEND